MKSAASWPSYENRIVIVVGDGDNLTQHPRLFNLADGSSVPITDLPSGVTFPEAVHLLADRIATVANAGLIVLRGTYAQLDTKLTNALLAIGPPGGGSPCGNPTGDPSPRGRFLDLANPLTQIAGDFFFSVWAESCLLDARIKDVAYEITASDGVTLAMVSGIGTPTGNGTPTSPLSITGADIIPARVASSNMSANNTAIQLRGSFPAGFAATSVTFKIRVSGNLENTTSTPTWFVSPSSFYTRTVSVV